jgi:hypothetical protein
MRGEYGDESRLARVLRPAAESSVSRGHLAAELPRFDGTLEASRLCVVFGAETLAS